MCQHGHAAQLCCLYAAGGRQRSIALAKAQRIKNFHFPCRVNDISVWDAYNRCNRIEIIAFYSVYNGHRRFKMENQQTSDTKESRINTQLLGIPKDEIRRIDVSEAEVVRRQYLSHIREPQVTIRPDGTSSIIQLSRCWKGLCTSISWWTGSESGW